MLLFKLIITIVSKSSSTISSASISYPSSSPSSLYTSIPEGDNSLGPEWLMHPPGDPFCSWLNFLLHYLVCNFTSFIISFSTLGFLFSWSSWSFCSTLHCLIDSPLKEIRNKELSNWKKET